MLERGANPMQNALNPPASAFVWNRGGWFGPQVGSTLWLLILGCVLLARDRPAAWICLSAGAALNGLGLLLWRDRGRRSAYASLQVFFGAATLVIALAVAAVNLRGVSEPPPPGALVSTYVPYWAMLLAPGLMLAFYLRERAQRRHA
jgi:hypothetical protein